MLSNPIPKLLLIHDIEIEKYINDRGKIFYAPKKKIKNVRIEFNEQKSGKYKDNTNEMNYLNNIMFVDAVNSEGFEEDLFELDSRVSWNNNIYIVKQVEHCYSENRLHHLEVTLT